MNKKLKIGGVPYEECEKYVWKIVHRFKYKYNTTIVDKEDLFNVGFIALTQNINKRYKKKGRVYLSSLANAIYFAMLRELDRFKYSFFISHNVTDKLRALRNKFANNSKLYDSEHNCLNFNELSKMGLVSSNSIDFYSKVEKLHVLPSYLIGHKFLQNERGCLEENIVANEQEIEEELEFKDEGLNFSEVTEEHCYLVEYLLDLDSISETDKKVAILYLGLKGQRKTQREIAKELGISQSHVSRSILQIKEILLVEGGWVESEFGTATCEKLRKGHK